MKKYIAIIIVVLISITYGCNNPVKHQNSEVSDSQPLTSSTESEHQNSEIDSIELNNGAKWQVVSEMMIHIRNMESDIEHFSKTENAELKDYTQIGALLQKNIDLLTSNCTMKGKAHDELHKWLLPYIDMVEKLNKSKNCDEALHTFEEIKSAFKIFKLYFE